MKNDGKTVTLIAAMAKNRGIGWRGQMPWHLPDELKHFKQTTMGKAIVMGRKTWESIGRALPGRQNIVVTRNRTYRAEGCDVVGSIEKAMELAEGSEVMVIGGGELYRQALPVASRMILTKVESEPAADTWFPVWDSGEWRLMNERVVPADERNTYAYRVQEWVRTEAGG